ncbi:MBL fold metallo-hydrolase [Bacterioplanoides pacificum]|uniref:MBL fold metallo-hydrolase n=1 Tax=Bacterioplanoides pacificum TaxID=1171596 RepID=A0ABV7VQA6_9GAMM
MTAKAQHYSLNFHGTGSGGQITMGSSAATLENDGQAVLLIDCGPGTIHSYLQRYQQLPKAIFISHCHLDHIADLEILTVRLKLQQQQQQQQQQHNLPLTRLFVPLNLLTTLHQRLATYPEFGTMAEGGHDFWQAFQLIPVTDEFYHAGLHFKLYANRHHAPNSGFSLHLPGVFFYSGDSRPIPEILHHKLTGNEVICHDCGLHPNPSHTGLSDLHEYREDIRQRLVLYHYANEQAAEQLQQAGYRVARPDQPIELNGNPS